MKRLILLVILLVLSLSGFSQTFGRITALSGAYDNKIVNGPDTFKLGWRTDRLQFKYNVDKRFIDFIKADSSVTIYNKLILTSPNDTMLSVRGDTYVQGNFMGGSTSASASNNSFAYGYGTASGFISTAFGAGTSTGFGSMSWGETGVAVGEYSTAWGGAFAGGSQSTAMGYSLSYGDFAVSSGRSLSNSYLLFTAGGFNDTTKSNNRISWVSTDALFQVGNGQIEFGIDGNDAFCILKNGKTFIGDSSSVTDAILIVDPTDSTITQLGMVKRTYVLTVNDDANLVLPDDFAGWVEVSALNSGTEDEYASFRINSDGTIAGLTFNTANVTLVLGTDGNLNIGTTSTKGVIENKLGGSRDFIVRIEGKLYLGM